MPNDSQKDIDFLVSIFRELLTVFTKPFENEMFDFSSEDFFSEIMQLGERFAKDKDLRNQNGGRGSKHFIYINRTFFGLYNLMFDLKSKDVVIDNYKKYI
jgi:predicted membrane GTPase involved in stress response